MIQELNDIAGNQELSGVGFIRDYIELYFDGPVIRLLGGVFLNNSSENIEIGLRNMIGKKLILISGNDLQISLDFGEDCILLVRRASGEMIHAQRESKDPLSIF